jgi:tetratricopeptide (TPR) repeat protein
VAALCAGSSAFGETRARERFAAAETAFDVGDFERARKLYTEAYGLEPLPAFLFDIAQCHRRLGQWSRAAFFFRRYVARVPADVDTSRVQVLIAEMDEQQKRVRSRAWVPRPAAGPVVTELFPAPPPDPAEPPLYTCWWFWAGAAATTVAVAVSGFALGATVSHSAR